MSCTKRFLNLRWTRHSWRRRVTAAETVPIHETTMWGTAANTTFVRCHAQYVCEECGTTRDEGNCLCDTARGERCPVRLAWIEEMDAASRAHVGR